MLPGALSEPWALCLVVAGGSVSGCILVAMMLVMLHQFRRRNHRDLLGRLLPPKVGHSSTLLIAGEFVMVA